MNLYPYQTEGRDFLAQSFSAILGDDMGLGKTRQVLAALPSTARVLVLCPASLRSTWVRECRESRPDLRPLLAYGDLSSLDFAHGTMVIATYAQARTLRPTRKVTSQPSLFERLEYPTHLVCDEAHCLKSRKGETTRQVSRYAESVRRAGGQTWFLTASPILNRPLELLSLLQVAGLLEIAYGSFDGFVEAFGGWREPIWVKGGIRQNILKFPDETPSTAASGLSKVMLRRLKRDVLPQLPTKEYRTIVVPTPRALHGTFDEAEEKAGKLGIDFEAIAEVRALLARSKIGAMETVLAEYSLQREPIVVFSAHQEPIVRIDSDGTRRARRAGIYGLTKPTERTRLVAAFQRGELDALGLTIATGGVGLTLTRAAHCLFVDRAWTPALNEQAEDRLCRLGQTRTVVVTDLVFDHPLDRRVTELCRQKKQLIDSTVTAEPVSDRTTPIQGSV